MAESEPTPSEPPPPRDPVVPSTRDDGKGGSTKGTQPRDPVKMHTYSEDRDPGRSLNLDQDG